MPAQICHPCGRPFAQPSAIEPAERQHLTDITVCSARPQQVYSFQLARSFGEYEGSLARAIVLLKFERMEPLGSWFAAARESGAREPPLHGGQVSIVPVPLDRKGQEERGYN